MRSAFQALRCKHYVRLSHVRAHEGHPVNEYVDTLAALAALGIYPTWEVRPWRPMFDDSLSARWAWLGCVSPEDRFQYPALTADGLLLHDPRTPEFFPPLSEAAGDVPDLFQYPDESKLRAEAPTLVIRMAFANVLKL